MQEQRDTKDKYRIVISHLVNGSKYRRTTTVINSVARENASEVLIDAFKDIDCIYEPFIEGFESKIRDNGIVIIDGYEFDAVDVIKEVNSGFQGVPPYMDMMEGQMEDWLLDDIIPIIFDERKACTVELDDDSINDVRIWIEHPVYYIVRCPYLGTPSTYTFHSCEEAMDYATHVYNRASTDGTDVYLGEGDVEVFLVSDDYFEFGDDETEQERYILERIWTGYLK